MTTATVAAPAKINLYLRVIAKRADGFHELVSLLHLLTLADEVTVTLTADGSVTLQCDRDDLGAAEQNLAVRAVRAWQQASGDARGAHVTLVKRVPHGAGLGGGSSDAAAVLRCLAALTGTDATDPRWTQAAAALGSDVPFFLTGGCAWAEGRGERLTELPPRPGLGVVVVKPPYGIATAAAYAGLRALTRVHLDGAAARALWAGGNDLLPHLCANDFAPGVFAAHPDAADAVAQLRAAGACAAHLTGSGSALFGLFPDAGAAQRAAAGLQVHGTVLVTETGARPAVQLT